MEEKQHGERMLLALRMFSCRGCNIVESTAPQEDVLFCVFLCQSTVLVALQTKEKVPPRSLDPSCDRPQDRHAKYHCGYSELASHYRQYYSNYIHYGTLLGTKLKVFNVQYGNPYHTVHKCFELEQPLAAVYTVVYNLSPNYRQEPLLTAVYSVVYPALSTGSCL